MQAEYGTILSFNAKNAYGFLSVETGPNVGEQLFVHVKQVIGRRALPEGSKVKFTIGEFKGRRQAENVVIIEGVTHADPHTR